MNKTLVIILLLYVGRNVVNRTANAAWAGRKYVYTKSMTSAVATALQSFKHIYAHLSIQHVCTWAESIIKTELTYNNYLF